VDRVKTNDVGQLNPNPCNPKEFREPYKPEDHCVIQSAKPEAKSAPTLMPANAIAPKNPATTIAKNGTTSKNDRINMSKLFMV
jgi:hypothetical protein